MTVSKICIGEIRAFWKPICLIITPFILIPILTVGTSEAKCAYCLALMAIYWIAEVVPLAVTAFMPIFLFPLFGILSAKETCENYLKDTNFLFVGGLIMAVAVEECNLHQRIALKVLTMVGAKPRWLMLGIMFVTAFLSMWISNTATTAMMAPIAIAVLEALVVESNEDLLVVVEKRSIGGINSGQRSRKNSGTANLIITSSSADAAVTNDKTSSSVRRMSMSLRNINQIRRISVARNEIEIDTKLDFKNLGTNDRRVCKAILLSICYAANFGGTGTLTGTGPNLVLRGQLDAYYKDADTGISFASWMAFAVPPLIIYLLIAWVWLQIAFMRPKGIRELFERESMTGASIRHNQRIMGLIRRRYQLLGSISFAEYSTLFWFLLLIFLWMFREPRFMPGWASFFGPKSWYITDSSTAMFISCILFAWPNRLPDLICWRRHKSNPPKKRHALVTWSAIRQKFPWSVVLLLGGGFALADGVRASGLSIWLGCELLLVLKDLSPPLINTVFATIITFVTEISSNTATATVFIPIMLSIAETLRVNPLYFALPATITPSFAFMLPVATPPNAIIYETGALSIIDMMFVGFVMNWLCIGIVLIMINTYATALFDLSIYPEWAAQFNRTNVC